MISERKSRRLPNILLEYGVAQAAYLLDLSNGVHVDGFPYSFTAVLSHVALALKQVDYIFLRSHSSGHSSSLFRGQTLRLSTRQGQMAVTYSMSRCTLTMLPHVLPTHILLVAFNVVCVFG